MSRHDFMSIDMNSQRSSTPSEKSAGYPAAAAASLRAAAVPQLPLDGLNGDARGFQVPISLSLSPLGATAHATDVKGTQLHTCNDRRLHVCLYCFGHSYSQGAYA